MPVFKYSAKDGPKNIEGFINAQTQSEAVEKIHHMGFVPVKIAVVEDSQAPRPAGSAASFSFPSRKIRSKDITVFTRQLASLMKSGVPILRSLQIIARQPGNPLLKGVMANVADAVKDGKTFSSAMDGYPDIFPPLYTAMVRSGESAGNLHDILFKMAEHRQKQEEVASRIKTALAYPILMMVVGAATIGFMFAFVMPRLIETFATLDQELPAVTKFLVAINNGLQKGWPFIIAGVGLVVLFLKRGINKDLRKSIIDRLLLRLPVVGEFVRKNELARFCRTMEMLLKSGIPVLSALETSIPVLDNGLIRAALLKSCDDLKQGGSLGRSLEQSDLFPVFMTSLIAVGEESGRLEDGLAEIADTYVRDTDELVKLMTSLMEPAIILFMGLIAGFIVIAMLLPIFEVNFMSG